MKVVHMPNCPACGTQNRDGARFCLQCATPLGAPVMIAAVEPARPSPDDEAWLAATLAADPLALPPPEAPPLPVAPAAPNGGRVMDETQPLKSAQPAPIIAGRYEIVAQQGEEVEAIDRQPWQRCWSCGVETNEAGELFCTQCGASLDGRRYRGQLRSGPPSGLGLVPSVKDPPAREMLPQIWDQVQADDALLTLVSDGGRTPLAPPIEELDALFVGRGLARLAAALHAEQIALGPLEPGDIELVAGRTPRLRTADGLRRLDDGDADAVAADLAAIAGLLEALTATPRTTRRLAAEDVPDSAEIGIVDVLREVRTGAISDAAALAARLDALIADQTAPSALRTRVGAATHQGMVRELDEDSLFYVELRAARKATPQTWGLYIVADGMGGHSAGEVASDMALRGAYEVVQSEYLAPTVDGNLPDEEARLKEVVKKAVLQANAYVLREAQARGNDMGTTITMALVAGDRAVIGNVGDSRTYLYRDGELRRISKDHSLVMRLVELGQITDEEVYTHPQRNAVLRSLGDKGEVQVDIFTERLRPGDALLLCSDGQWEMTRDHEMAKIIAEHDDPQAACDALIAAANAAGGDDNITALLVKFEAP